MKNPSRPLSQIEIDAIASITAYYENRHNGTGLLVPEILHYLPYAGAFIQGTQVNTVHHSQWWSCIVEHGEGVEFSRKDVGALFHYERGNYKSFITTEYLMKLAQTRNLNDAQLHEVEHLLNKAGRSLGMNLAPVPTATEADLKEALFTLILNEIEGRPKYFHQNFLDTLAQKGIPVDMKNADFHKFVQDNLKP